MESYNDKTAVLTIFSKNYLHFVRTLFFSVRQYHPEWVRFGLLVDKLYKEFNPTDEPFNLIEVSQLDLPHPRKFLFRYTQLEANTAVKPYAINHLFDMGFKRVIYLDPDIFLYHRMDEVDHLLNKGSLMVLTPHLLAPVNDNFLPNETSVLQTGTFNLGFIALGRHPDLYPFLAWWKDRLEYDCIVDLPGGLFIDQKWLNLAPGLFDDVHILRHPGYNAAYWNLKQRSISIIRDNWVVNGRPLVFFHFSGLNPAKPSELSRHQNRFSMSDIGVVQVLVLRYIHELHLNGFEQFKDIPYFFNYFSDGTPIRDIIRWTYRSSQENQKTAGEDPFSSPWDWLNRPGQGQYRKKPLVTNLMAELWKRRADLQRAFPDPWDRDRNNFCRWFIASAEREMALPSVFIDPVRNSLL